MAGRYKKKKRSAPSKAARAVQPEQPGARVLSINKMISNRDKAIERAQTLKSKGMTEQALEALKRAERWQAEIDKR